MNAYDEEMLYHAKRIKSLCKSRYSCAGCPFRYTNPLDEKDIKCMLMSGIRPELWNVDVPYYENMKGVL